jgi:hypothetical protein
MIEPKDKPSITVEGDSRMKWPPLGPNASAEDIANRAAAMAGVSPVFPEAYYTADAWHPTKEEQQALAQSIVHHIKDIPLSDDATYKYGTPENAAYLEGLSQGSESDFHSGVVLAEEKIIEWLVANGFHDAAIALDASDATDALTYQAAANKWRDIADAPIDNTRLRGVVQDVATSLGLIRAFSETPLSDENDSALSAIIECARAALAPPTARKG